MFFLKHKITNFREFLLYYRKKFKQLRNTKTIKTMGKTVKRELKYVWWKRNYFPHIILERPREINEMSKSNGITRADDLFFVKDKYVYWGKMDIYIGLGFLVFTSFGAFSRDAFEIPGVFFLILYFLIGILYIVYHYTHPPKKIILDRLNGIITFPGVFYGKPITMPFDKVLAALKLNGKNGPVSLGFYHHKILATDIDLDHTPIKSWSFIVWYMDKNRPLPPGKVFDPYRKRDYERRKAEGFPEPLYESWISIFEYYEYYDEQFQARKEQEERQKRRNKRNNKYK